MPEGDDLGRKAVRSITWVIAERWSSRVLTLVVFAVLTRLLTPAEFGLVSLATAFVVVLQVFVDSGLSKALIQRKELAEKDASTAFWTSLGLAFVLYAALFLAAPLIAQLFDQPALVLVLRVMGAGLPLTALSATPAALLERDFKFGVLSVRQLVGTVGGSLLAIPVAVLGGGVWALVVQFLAAALISVVTMWASTPWRPRFEFSLDSLRSLWGVGISILGIGLLDAVYANVDKIIIGAFFSADVLGFYFIAQRAAAILTDLVTSVLARISLTTYSRVQDDLPRLNRIFRQLTFVAGAVAIPVFGLVAVLAPQLFPLVFGEGWEQSIPIFWIFAPNSALFAVMSFDRSVMIATGHEKAALLLAFGQNVLGVLLAFVLLPFGILGVALSRWARLLLWPVRLGLLHRYIQLPVGHYLLQVARAAAAVVPVVCGVGLLQLTPWAEGPHAFWAFALPLAVIGLVTYAGLLWLIAGDDNRVLIRRSLAPILRRARKRRNDS
ncbi:oligosaccharide flippase family protein [Agromyces sp. CFH 90414]|uniref:Oligosaccharide flippase family protein n=1 Tax=Agromyces agglutinans TaxID=2662258 RepID=A0A6I2FD66_9MICO|nr:lipopolysaccharide biosynthesis protein [Agromyces agglutinans]MRG60436.1 oligosaccharide flippase family protein [Agromyces agglutinans]